MHNTRKVATSLLLAGLFALLGTGCQFFNGPAWYSASSLQDADIRAKAKKDPFPAADEPAVESIKR